MKKQLIALALAGALLCPAGAFQDISDTGTAQNAAILNSLGIMQGVGGDRFDPNSSLTRAQFCKLAVTALGVKDVDAYRNFTIFPDVKPSNWAAGYINAAVRQSELAKRQIIRGYADGTFGPERTVTLGEACTMVLRMLDYTESDVGPFWPNDYVQKATDLGVLRGVSATDANAAIARADAAAMLVNALGAKTKGEDDVAGPTLLSKVSSGTQENCVLLATSQTVSDLRSNEALIFDGTAAVIKQTDGTLDRALVGVSGTLVFDKDKSSTVIGIVPNQNKTETLSVRAVAADGITSDSGKTLPNRSTPLYTGGTTVRGTYGEAWADIAIGSTLHYYYDDAGSLLLLASLPQTVSGGGSALIYGVTASAIPSGYVIEKNGVTIDSAKVQPYDVITLDPIKRIAKVSDTRLSGVYTAGAPTFSYPQTVTMYGTAFSISDAAAAYFSGLTQNDYITLLFDADGSVVAAYPKRTVSADMRGVLHFGENSSIRLLSGLTLTPSLAGSDWATLDGSLISFGQRADGTVYASRLSTDGAKNGSWLIAQRKLGTLTVSPEVQIFEEVELGAPLYQIRPEDILQSAVPANRIRTVLQDNAGTVTGIVLDNFTGESLLYGIGSVSYSGETDASGNVINKSGWTATLRYVANNQPTTLTFTDDREDAPTTGSNDALRGFSGMMGLSRGFTVSGRIVDKGTISLQSIGLVSVADFDGLSRVRVGGTYHDVADNVTVYQRTKKVVMTLAEAKVNYKEFRLYVNPDAMDNGKIRVIEVS